MAPPSEEILLFESVAVEKITGDLTAQLDTLVMSIMNAYRVTHENGLSEAGAVALGKQTARRLTNLPTPDLNNALLRHAKGSRDLGVIRAVRTLEPGKTRDLATNANWRQHGKLDVPDANATLADTLKRASLLAKSGIRTKAELASVLGALRSARADARATARFVVHEGINAGTAEVARTIEQRLLWVPERNACLHCLAHAGWVVEPGKDLPAGLSFDPRGSKLRAVPHPPLHPGCRCEAELTTLPAGKPPADRSIVDESARLAAEARRSVVYQWTDYASGPAAQRAAEALLKLGAGLPATVEKRARASIRKGGVKRPS